MILQEQNCGWQVFERLEYRGILPGVTGFNWSVNNSFCAAFELQSASSLSPSSSKVVMPVEKRLLNTPLDLRPDISVIIDGMDVPAAGGELLIEAINRALPDRHLPQVCYHRAMGPIETCDTCMVELDGKLVRACSTKVAAGMSVITESQRADMAQREAFDRILQNHDLYCTVCDNNNGNCTVHNTVEHLMSSTSRCPFRGKPYEEDIPIRSTATIRTSASSAAAASRPARTCR